MSETKIFQWYVNHVWPIQRRFVGATLAKRCKKCFLSEAQVKLENGECPFCREFSEKKELFSVSEDEQKKLRELFLSLEGRGMNAYDAVVLYSGGKDSTYLIMEIKNKFPKLRMLALSIDTGFLSPVAIENIKNGIEKLGVDHMFFSPEKKFYIELYRYALKNVGQRGSYEVIDRLGGDALHDIGRNVAAKLSVPAVISGISPSQVTHILNLNTAISPEELERKKRVQSADFFVKDIFPEDYAYKYFWNGEDFSERLIPKVIFPFYAWGYDEEKIFAIVNEKGFMDKKNSSPIVTNNTLIPLMGVLDIKRLGYSSFEMEFASLVREGKADRNRWLYIFEFLEYVAKKNILLKKSVDNSLNQLSLTREDLGL